jgi:hypothetical protein
MNTEFTSSKWFLLLVAIVLPLILLAAAAALNAGICVMIVLLVWIGTALILLYLPKNDY